MNCLRKEASYRKFCSTYLTDFCTYYVNVKYRLPSLLYSINLQTLLFIITFILRKITPNRTTRRYQPHSVYSTQHLARKSPNSNEFTLAERGKRAKIHSTRRIGVLTARETATSIYQVEKSYEEHA